MKLLEFFGKQINTDTQNLERKDDKNISNEVFWYILDHDRIHKDYFVPLAKKIKHQYSNNKEDHSQYVKEFMPMVEKGCKEYYLKNKMSGKLGKVFPKEMREGLAQKLHDHYYDDIIKDCYNLGL